MKIVIMSIGALLCLTLSGCCGGEDADLVVVNNSDRDACSIVLEYSGSTETVQAADGSVLLKPGQTYGLELEEGEVLVTLRDRAQRTIGRSRVARQEGQRLFLTFDGVTEGSLSAEKWPHESSSKQNIEEKEEPGTPENQEEASELDAFYQNPATQPYEDIRTLGESYDKGQAQMDNCFVISAMVHNDYLYYEFMEHCQNKEDAFIRVVQGGTEGRGIVIDDILYDSKAGKIYLVHDAARDNLAAEMDRSITLNEFEDIAEYKHDGHLYWIAFNGEISNLDFDSDEVFVITLIN